MAKKKYYQRPDGLYEVSRTINGKRLMFRGKTCREVDQKILAYQQQKDLGRKFPEVADEWEREHEPEIRENTRRVYHYAVQRLKEAFQDVDIGTIRPLDIKRYISDFEREGRAANSVQIELSVCKQIFAHAVLSRDIDISPASEIHPSRGLPAKKREALTEEQEAVVRQSGIDRTAPNWLFPYFLLYTGLRRGEALALSYSDIDRKAGTIRINKKLSYAYGNIPVLEYHTKSENGIRTVPLLPPLAQALPKGRVGLIFPGEDGDFMRAAEITKNWRAYCVAVGFVERRTVTTKKRGVKREEVIEEFPITPHCFRHSFATICYEAGVDARQTAKILGDSVAVVEKIYTHLRAKHAQSASDLLSAYCAVTV